MSTETTKSTDGREELTVEQADRIDNKAIRITAQTFETDTEIIKEADSDSSSATDGDSNKPAKTSNFVKTIQSGAFVLNSQVLINSNIRSVTKGQKVKKAEVNKEEKTQEEKDEK